MRSLRLYPDGAPKAGIENVDPAPSLDPDCSLCPLGAKARSVCMAPTGIRRTDGPTLLYISDHPDYSEDANGRRGASAQNHVMGKLLKRLWPHSIVMDYAIKCFPGRGTLSAKASTNCARYLRHVIDRVQPERIIVSSSVAIRMLTGRTLEAASANRAFSWMSDGTPIFPIVHPARCVKNKWMMEDLEAAVQWACETNPRKLLADMPWISDALAHFVDTPEDSQNAVEHLRTASLLGWDTEAAGRPYQGFMELLTCAVAGDRLEDVYVWERHALSDPALAGPLLELLTDPDIPKVCHNEMFDRSAVYDVYGEDPDGCHGDTMVWTKIAEPEARAKLDYQQWRVGMGGGKELSEQEEIRVLKIARKRSKAWTDEDVKEYLIDNFGPENLFWAMHVRKAKGVDTARRYSYALYNPEVRGRYCAIDALSTVRLAEKQEPEIFGSEARTTVWSELMGPGQDAFLQMQRWGCPANKEKILDLADSLQEQIEDLEGRIADVAGNNFNPASSPQVQALLFEELRLPVYERSKATNKPSASSGALQKLSGKHPIVDLLLEYRSATKLATYPVGWLDWIMADGRFHPSYRIDGARSGRPSCVDPNLFNIPRGDTPNGAKCRLCIEADEPDDFIFQRDLSQAELRALAALSKDPEMREIFISGEDYHTRTAQLIAPKMWGVDDWGALDKGQQKFYRTQTKAVNFGLVYGKTAATLAKDLGCTIAEAEAVIEAVLGKFSVARDWMARARREVKATGGIWTEWPIGQKARYRPLKAIGDAAIGGKRTGASITAENGAVNTPVQGFASDLCLTAIIRLVHWIKREGLPIRIILSVYDSILFQVPSKYVERLYWASKRCMEEFDLNGVPMVSDPEIGRSWGGSTKMMDVDGCIYVKTGTTEEGEDVYTDLSDWLRNN